MATSSYSHVNECKPEISVRVKDEPFDEDMETLNGEVPVEVGDIAAASDSGGENGDEIDHLELDRRMQQRFPVPLVVNPAPVPSNHQRPRESEDEDGIETLGAIRRRFAEYDSDSLKKKAVLTCATSIKSEVETPNVAFGNGSDGGALRKEFPGPDEALSVSQSLGSFCDANPDNYPSQPMEWHRPEETCIFPLIPIQSSTYPKSGQTFIDALKKNRACQKFIRSNMIQIEARIEDNKELKGYIKCLVKLQVSCEKKVAKIFYQKKDAHVKLISLPKSRISKVGKANDKKIPAINFGPAGNSDVSKYKMVFTKFPVSPCRQPWSKIEQENLMKGIKQQFQGMLLQKPVDLDRGSDGSSGGSNVLGNMTASITNLEITPEDIRSFLPQVDWEKLASTYARRRSGVECEARWLNTEDPIINHNPWTNLEDKNLLFIVQQRGTHNWIDISIKLGTNRTPFQCLARYRQSLDAYIVKKDWTVDEDAKLRAVVEALGEGDWQLIASNLEGRKGVQCSNRWRQCLHPDRKKVGRWAVDEDKRLKIAVMLFGPKTWKKIAQFIPGRTDVQCRERWFNVLDPSLSLEEWTEEEDSKLKAAIVEHGHCWSKVALFVPHRTDNQCRRRWKVLLPHEVPLVQEARKMMKTALISNFVDREHFRPSLGPKDFQPPTVPGTNSVYREMPKTKRKNIVPCDVPQQVSSQRSRIKIEACSEEILRSDGDAVETFSRDNTIRESRDKMLLLCKSDKYIQPAEDHVNILHPGHSISDIMDASSHWKSRTVVVTQQAKSKISRTKGKTCFEDMLKTTDNGDVEHAPVLRKKVMRGRLNISENEIIQNLDFEAFLGKKRKNKRALNLPSERDKCSQPPVQHSTLEIMDIDGAALRELSRKRFSSAGQF